MRPPIINVMDRAARRAGRNLARDFGEVEKLQVSKKGAADFVSAADLRAEKILHAELTRARPDFGFLGEERGLQATGDGIHRFVVDPLDGTTNFLHGLPHFAISIALEEKGQLVAGIVYDPLREELFWAARNLGAFLNDQRLRVSARQQLASAVIATGIPFLGHGDHARYLPTFGALMGEVAGIRRMGAAALDMAYVAAGRFDGYWEFGVSPWDIAAGTIIVREAGGFVTDARGGDGMAASGDVIAANDQLHDRLCKLIRAADPGATKAPA